MKFSVKGVFVVNVDGNSIKLLATGQSERRAFSSWPALTEWMVAGIHFVQEDSPDEIGRAIAGWVKTLGSARAREAGSLR